MDSITVTNDTAFREYVRLRIAGYDHETAVQTLHEAAKALLELKA